MITTEQLENAETAASSAEQHRTALEAEMKDNPYSEALAIQLAGAIQKATQLRANAVELRDMYEAELAAARAKASRADIEKGAAKQIGQAERDMKTAADKLQTSVVAAQGALVALLDDAAAYGAQLQKHSSALRLQGLTPEPDVDHQTIGTENGLLRIKGHWYRPVDAGTVLGWLVQRVAAARLPRMDGLAHLLMRYQLRVDSHTDSVLDGIRKPESLPCTEPLRVRTADVRPLVAGVKQFVEGSRGRGGAA